MMTDSQSSDCHQESGKEETTEAIFFTKSENVTLTWKFKKSEGGRKSPAFGHIRNWRGSGETFQGSWDYVKLIAS